MSPIPGEQLVLGETRRIPPPDPDLEPLKANVYERMAKAAAQLMPLFPYDHAGAVVPCGNVLVGGPEASYGHFFHWNTVNEVVVVYGSKRSLLAPGQIMATQNLHGVNSSSSATRRTPRRMPSSSSPSTSPRRASRRRP